MIFLFSLSFYPISHSIFSNKVKVFLEQQEKTVSIESSFLSPMNSPIVLMEREFKSTCRHPSHRQRVVNRVEFLLSLVLYGKVKRSEQTQHSIQSTLSNIISTLAFHADEITRLSNENRQTSTTIVNLQSTNKEMRQMIDKLILKMNSLEQEVEFEQFKNKEILNKHESLISSMANSKTKFSFIIDAILLYFAYRATVRIACKFNLGLSSSYAAISSAGATQLVAGGGGTLEKVAEIIALFLILKSIKHTISPRVLYSR